LHFIGGVESGEKGKGTRKEDKNVPDGSSSKCKGAMDQFISGVRRNKGVMNQSISGTYRNKGAMYQVI